MVFRTRDALVGYLALRTFRLLRRRRAGARRAEWVAGAAVALAALLAVGAAIARRRGVFRRGVGTGAQPGGREMAGGAPDGAAHREPSCAT
ncbi:MAG: hypothetical protein RMM28_03970 [Thermoleophilia bacterium]|nr:hypothetical protein [Gaiellaceae bacterium]MDW8338277.1 hypothetical protein [Thermoleophilia bacterium]